MILQEIMKLLSKFILVCVIGCTSSQVEIKDDLAKSILLIRDFHSWTEGNALKIIKISGHYSWDQYSFLVDKKGQIFIFDSIVSVEKNRRRKATDKERKEILFLLNSCLERFDEIKRIEYLSRAIIAEMQYRKVNENIRHSFIRMLNDLRLEKLNSVHKKMLVNMIELLE